AAMALSEAPGGCLFSCFLLPPGPAPGPVRLGRDTAYQLVPDRAETGAGAQGLSSLPHPVLARQQRPDAFVVCAPRDGPVTAAHRRRSDNASSPLVVAALSFLCRRGSGVPLLPVGCPARGSRVHDHLPAAGRPCAAAGGVRLPLLPVSLHAFRRGGQAPERRSD